MDIYYSLRMFDASCIVSLLKSTSGYSFRYLHLMPCLKQNFRNWIGQNSQSKMLLSRLLLSLFELDVVRSDEVCNNDLDLCARKESAWTSPYTVPEVDIIHTGRGVLVF